jgi:hypothetical protein
LIENTEEVIKKLLHIEQVRLAINDFEGNLVLKDQGLEKKVNIKFGIAGVSIVTKKVISCKFS